MPYRLELTIPREDPVIAFREWQIKDGMLVSRFRHLQWQPGPNRASCPYKPLRHITRPDLVPHPNCECGLYVLPYPDKEWKRCPDCRRAGLRRFVCDEHLSFAAYGSVRIWGRVEAHRYGVRVEYAELCYLLAHHLGPEHRHQLELAANRYQVELRGWLRFEHDSYKHGRRCPAQLERALQAAGYRR